MYFAVVQQHKTSTPFTTSIKMYKKKNKSQPVKIFFRSQVQAITQSVTCFIVNGMKYTTGTRKFKPAKAIETTIVVGTRFVVTTFCDCNNFVVKTWLR